MAQHDKKIIPEVPALDFSFGNYGQGTDYTKDSQRMKDLYLETNIIQIFVAFLILMM